MDHNFFGKMLLNVLVAVLFAAAMLKHGDAIVEGLVSAFSMETVVTR